MPVHSRSGAPDYDRTLVLAIELSNASWGWQLRCPACRVSRRSGPSSPRAEALLAAIQGYRERAKTAGRDVERVVATYEAGWSGFWLARWLATHGIETHVVQPSGSGRPSGTAGQVRRDRRGAALAHAAGLAAGEPRVCSMVPIPTEADEDARRCVREREELVAERVALVNRIGAVLATLGVGESTRCRGTGASASTRCARRSGRCCRRTPTPRSAVCSTAWTWCARRSPTWSRSAMRCWRTRRRIGRRDDPAARTCAASVCRAPPLWCARRSCASSPTARRSAPTRAFRDAVQQRRQEREQGISKAGNRRLRTVMVELAWLWQRYQPGSAQVSWFRERVGGTGSACEGNGDRVGEKTAHCLVAFRHPGRGAGGCGHEARVLIGSEGWA